MWQPRPLNVRMRSRLSDANGLCAANRNDLPFVSAMSDDAGGDQIALMRRYFTCTKPAPTGRSLDMAHSRKIPAAAAAPSDVDDVIQTRALPVDRIKALKVAAEPVKGESVKDRKLRALHVMSMLRGYGQPELWGHVSQHFVKKGKLDLSELLSNTNLPDLVYLLQSGAASDVTRLVLNYNDVFAGEEAGRALGAALANMSTLCELHLMLCSLTDRSWVHIADGIIRGCRQLKTLLLEQESVVRVCCGQRLDDNAVFADEEAGRVLGAALANMSQLCKLSLTWCSLTDRSWVHIADGIIWGCRQMETLNLNYNAVFADEEAIRSLGTALANMSQLCKLNLAGCSLTDRSWVDIADGVSRGCRQLKTLNCCVNELTNDSEETMKNLLTRLPHLNIGATRCGLTRPSKDRLKAEFGRRFYLIV
ncbi:hypothetical protein LSAT2_029761 [Lamellibrachia satsuma]|nr:hypothetical protein LSAT2_029761 [Lamellibrachia satsuma]